MQCCHLTPCHSLHRGPFSDRYGRRLTYNLSTLMFLGTTLGCTFSPNIQVLILMRALQGFAREQKPAGAPAACVTASMHASGTMYVTMHQRHSRRPTSRVLALLLCCSFIQSAPF